MTRTATKTASLIVVWLVSALLVLLATAALANPNFGDPRFRLLLQQDAGMVRIHDPWDRPCPTIRGCPLPVDWGPQWRLDNEWVRFVERFGHPPGQDWRADRTPARKWNTIVERYRWWMNNYDGRRGARWEQPVTGASPWQN